LKQVGGSLEKFFTKLQGLWREIDFRRPNAVECVVDIQHYNTMIQEERVYTFWMAWIIGWIIFGGIFCR
jgi:hypothetical protein